MRFVWDEAKNSRNRKRHGVSFEQASTLFTRGGEYLDIFDEAHSSDEDRFIAIGPVSRGIVLVVYTEEEENVVRIISARFATKREAEMYRSYVRGGLQ
ncbi:BrnT family toxin [Candidatus Binatia bacterium]|nr:BrnT family toxin [Candidatus Binatia bacterium]